MALTNKTKDLPKLTDEQQELVNDAIRFVYYIMANSRLPTHIKQERDDIISECFLDLCKAAQRFDAEKGTRWRSYSYSCIYRTPSEYMRKKDILTRRERKKVTALECSINKLKCALGRIPTFAEVAKDLEISIDELHTIYTTTQYSVALETLSSLYQNDIYDEEFLPEIPDCSLLPEQTLLTKEDCANVNYAIEKLPEDLGNLVKLHFLEDVPVSKLTKILNLSERSIRDKLKLAKRLLRPILERLVVVT